MAYDGCGALFFLLKTYKEEGNSLLFSIFVVKIRNDD